MSIHPAATRRLLLAVLATGALALASCGSGAGTSPSTQGTSSSGSAGASSSTDASGSDSAQAAASLTSDTAGLAPLGDASTDNKTQHQSSDAQLVVTGMRYGSHDGFDRVVFDLTGTGTPGWFTELTPNPAQQGSGNAVEYKGNTALVVNIDGVTYPFELGIEDPNLAPIDASGGVVTGVQSLGTFEGRAQFVIGLNGSHAYSVQTLDNPSRLVVDIRRD